MRRKGINYDTGFTGLGAPSSREVFDPPQVRREIETIARDLHCTAVRISGSDPHYDLDCASYGVVKMLDGGTVKVYPGMPWGSKRSFYALAEYYQRSN